MLTCKRLENAKFAHLTPKILLKTIFLLITWKFSEVYLKQLDFLCLHLNRFFRDICENLLDVSKN